MRFAGIPFRLTSPGPNMIIQSYSHVKRGCLSNGCRHFQCQNELPSILINILWDLDVPASI
jgi:hypothetical protein